VTRLGYALGAGFLWHRALETAKGEPVCRVDADLRPETWRSTYPPLHGNNEICHDCQRLATSPAVEVP
jgi:hypothetical protein